MAEVDRAHEGLSGPAMRHILQREYEAYGDKPYERVARISVAHLYNLRASMRYRNQAMVFEPTRPTAIAIGVLAQGSLAGHRSRLPCSPIARSGPARLSSLPDRSRKQQLAVTCQRGRRAAAMRRLSRQSSSPVPDCRFKMGVTLARRQVVAWSTDRPRSAMFLPRNSTGRFGSPIHRTRSAQHVRNTTVSSSSGVCWSRWQPLSRPPSMFRCVSNPHHFDGASQPFSG